jgi:phosphoribosylanthranilate isomerase
MTWVKICGITNLEDALTAVEAGADALGFVFYEKSPRNVDSERVHQIVEQVPTAIEKVGVFVDRDAQQIREIALRAGLTAVQLHGKVPMESVGGDLRPAIECVGVSKIIPTKGGDTLKDGGVLITEHTRGKIFAVLLDSLSDAGVGGTGTTFDWEATRGMVQLMGLSVPVIVAGGLNPLNVKEAIRTFQPFGVDVSSGVEARPGKKDPGKVRAFIAAVRQADKVH